jgi:cytochrome P450
MLIAVAGSPERWIDGSVGEQAKSIPGVWGSMLSFLGGSHACIGYKFALYEYAIFPSAAACFTDAHTERRSCCMR